MRSVGTQLRVGTIVSKRNGCNSRPIELYLSPTLWFIHELDMSL